MGTPVVSTDMPQVQEPKIFSTNEHFEELSKNLQVHFQKQNFCDITLTSTDDAYKIKAHKLVLSSVSEYFRKLFEEREAFDVHMNDIDGRSLEAILGFIYTGTIELTPETVKCVYKGSHSLQIESLKKICLGYMTNRMDTTSQDSGISDLEFTELYSAACESVVTLPDRKDFLSLNLKQLCKLISSDDLRVKSEDDVVRAVMEWINFKRNERSQFLSVVLPHVRFPLLSLKSICKYTDILMESTERAQIFCDIVKWQLDPDVKSTKFSREQCRIRSFKDVIIAIRTHGPKQKDLTVQLFYSGLNKWICVKWPALPRAPKNMMYTRLDRRLIVANKGSYYVNCLNLETLEWSEFPHFPTPDVQALAASNGIIYAMGSGKLHMIKEPFIDWWTIEDAVFEDVRVFTVFERSIYFRAEGHICAFDVVDKTFRKEIEYKTDYSPVWLNAFSHLYMDFFLEHYPTRYGAALRIYNLRTGTYWKDINLPHGSVDKIELQGTQIFACKGTQSFQLDIFEGEVEHLPDLAHTADILLWE